LQHLLAVLNSNAPDHRKDQVAAACLPYMHPRLNLSATSELNGGGRIASIVVLGIPRGCQFNPQTQMVVYADGTETDAPAFTPIAPTPAITDQTSAPPEPERATDPLPVIEPEPGDNIQQLAAWRRRSDDT
jgi:hypothetical protein